MNYKYTQMQQLYKKYQKHIIDIRSEKLRIGCYNKHPFQPLDTITGEMYSELCENNLFGKILYKSIEQAIKHRKEDLKEDSNYLVASISFIDMLYRYLYNWNVPGFNTDEYLYELEISNIKLKILQDSVGRGHCYQFEIF